MVEFLETDREALFQEVVERGRTEGIASQEAFNDLVEEIIQEHLDVKEMHDDNSTVGLSEQMKGRWPEYQAALGLDRDRPQL